MRGRERLPTVNCFFLFLANSIIWVLFAIFGSFIRSKAFFGHHQHRCIDLNWYYVYSADMDQPINVYVKKHTLFSFRFPHVNGLLFRVRLHYFAFKTHWLNMTGSQWQGALELLNDMQTKSILATVITLSNCSWVGSLQVPVVFHLLLVFCCFFKCFRVQLQLACLLYICGGWSREVTCCWLESILMLPVGCMCLKLVDTCNWGFQWRNHCVFFFAVMISYQTHDLPPTRQQSPPGLLHF